MAHFRVFLKHIENDKNDENFENFKKIKYHRPIRYADKTRSIYFFCQVLLVVIR